MLAHSPPVSVPGCPGLGQAEVLQAVAEHLHRVRRSEVGHEDELCYADTDGVEAEDGQEQPEVFSESEPGVEGVGWGRGAGAVVPPVDL